LNCFFSSAHEERLQLYVNMARVQPICEVCRTKPGTMPTHLNIFAVSGTDYERFFVKLTGGIDLSILQTNKKLSRIISTLPFEFI
jgi:hypothetical protein